MTKLSKLSRIKAAWRTTVRLATHDDSYLIRSGWFQSQAKRQSIDASGMPLPWYTYSAINFIGSKLNSRMQVFEYGSGNSTLWYARHVAHVTACEHDHDWATMVRQKLSQNTLLIENDLGDAYVDEIAKHDRKFDVIVIDGRMRNLCAERCMPFLTANGVIIWDNSDRPEYQAGLKMLMELGFRCVDFTGMGPINVYGWTTSIFYRDNNVFEM